MASFHPLACALTWAARRAGDRARGEAADGGGVPVHRNVNNTNTRQSGRPPGSKSCNLGTGASDLFRIHGHPSPHPVSESREPLRLTVGPQLCLLWPGWGTPEARKAPRGAQTSTSPHHTPSPGLPRQDRTASQPLKQSSKGTHRETLKGAGATCLNSGYAHIRPSRPRLDRSGGYNESSLNLSVFQPIQSHWA